MTPRQRNRGLLVCTATFSILALAVAWKCGLFTLQAQRGPGENVRGQTVRTLAYIMGGQDEFKQRRFLDADGNGIAEFGDLRALLNENMLVPSWKESAGGTWRDRGEDGFELRLWLPDAIPGRERHWCAIATPCSGNRSQKSFLVTDRDRFIWEGPALNRPPTLSDVYNAEPFTSALKSGWRRSAEPPIKEVIVYK